ncbi:MAG TPA: hypothetical protein VEY93_12130 [Longimicrobium sp.]|nr:hypothetical protein [Longimicrobium sp.]
MPSRALQVWHADSRRALDEIESAHRAVGGAGRGRRTATQQINQAYAVLLASQFQRFCRDLHTECVEHLVECAVAATFGFIMRSRFLEGRKLDAGNPNPGNIGSDYGRLGIPFWDAVAALDTRNKERQRTLSELNVWRNAIAHQDFTHRELHGRHRVRLAQVRSWRAACNRLAVDFDRAVHAHLTDLTGTSPWQEEEWEGRRRSR